MSTDALFYIIVVADLIAVALLVASRNAYGEWINAGLIAVILITTIMATYLVQIKQQMEELTP